MMLALLVTTCLYFYSLTAHVSKGCNSKESPLKKSQYRDVSGGDLKELPSRLSRSGKGNLSSFPLLLRYFSSIKDYQFISLASRTSTTVWGLDFILDSLLSLYKCTPQSYIFFTGWKLAIPTSSYHDY